MTACFRLRPLAFDPVEVRADLASMAITDKMARLVDLPATPQHLEVWYYMTKQSTSKLADVEQAAAILHTRCISKGAGNKFLGAERFNKLILRFHVKFLSTSCVNGKDFLPRHWRHVAASSLHGIGRSEDAKGRLLHASHATFETYYALTPHPEFVSCWLALSISLRGHLSAEEALLV